MVEDTGTERHQGAPGVFADDSDEELLLYMADREENPTEARGAWEEFYRRHAEYVLGICRRACRGMLEDDMVNGIMVDTLRKVYESAQTYKLGDDQHADRTRRRVRSWLGVIARNTTIDLLRGRRDSGAVQIEPEEWERIDGKRERSVSKDTAAVRRLMEEVLDDREQVVLWTTYLYYNPDKENQRLPNDVVDQLCECFATTPANLRRIRKKATEKMKKALAAAGYQSRKDD